MSKWLEAIGPYLEVVYFLAGIVIAVAAVIALKQLQIAKLSLKTQSMRDALKLTVQECSNYFERIIPMQDALDQILAKDNIELMPNSHVSIKREMIEIKLGDIDDSDELDPHFDKLRDVLNAMEGFSTFFMSGVADEKVAYDAVGSSYIDFLKDYIGWAVFCNKEGYYKNLIDLYILWYSRNKRESLMSKRKSIRDELENLPEVISYVVGADKT